MFIIYGESEDNGSYLYKKNINKKTFYYYGEQESGTFIEEIVYNSIVDNHPELKDVFFQVVVNFNDSIYLSSFNDASESEAGEPTLHYSKNDFNEDEINTFLNDFIFVKFDELWIVTVENNVYSFSRTEKEINFSINEKDLRCEIVLSGFEQFKTFMKNIRAHIFMAFLMLLIVIGHFYFSDKSKKHNEEKVMFELNNELRVLNTEKSTLNMEIKSASKKYNEILITKDLFDNKELLEKLNKI
jgi:cbb3-type cytochrome oxidase subunit 3